MGWIGAGSRDTIDCDAGDIERVENLPDAPGRPGLLADEDCAPVGPMRWVARSHSGDHVGYLAVGKTNALDSCGRAGRGAVDLIADDRVAWVIVVRPERNHVGVLTDSVADNLHRQLAGDGDSLIARRGAGRRVGRGLDWLSEAE